MTRVALYARFSSENQRDASIDDQVRICRVRAEREGWQVVSVLSDYALSGASTLRPGYQQLLELIRRGGTDIVLAESLDRFSRDQEHIPGFFKQAQFAGVKIVTLTEGEISELHIGLKGTMGALYLKDLADKTRRGLEGRVRQGHSGGGICYGYRVVRGVMGRDGEPERGLREIDPGQAEVIRRIFTEFAAGKGPKSIAAGLNQDGIPGPRGGHWIAGAIRGQPTRSTGILRNRLYVGEMLWNQRRWLKDPSTGLRVARSNASSEVLIQQVPELRIIDDTLWLRVQARLQAQSAKLDAGEASTTPKRRFWEQRRPQHLLSGKIICGSCGKPFMSVGRDYLTCRVAEARGPCDNRARIRRQPVEAEVIQALETRLMEPELVATFVAEFAAEWNRLRAEASAGLVGRRRELEAVDRKLDGLIDAIADGLRTPGLQGRLDELEQRKQNLRSEIAAAEAGPELPRLHGNLAEVYRAKVARLREAFLADGGTETLEAARALIDRVEVHPPAEPGVKPRLELLGELSMMLRLASGAQQKGPELNGLGPDVMSSIKGDAGTGFEPVTFRL